MGEDRKRFVVKTVWEWSGESFPQGSPWVSGAVLEGIGSGGVGFLMFQWKELVFFVNLALAFRQWPQDRQRILLQDGLMFAEWLREIKDWNARQFRHMLLFMLFPDEFERIFGQGDRQAIVSAFSDHGSHAKKKLDPNELDRALREIRTRLEIEHRTKDLDFYSLPVRGRWERKSGPADKVSIVRPPVESQASEPDPAPVTSDRAFTFDEALDGLFIDHDKFRAILDRLRKKKNLILQGPPGVGKTFFAQRLAYALIGSRSPARVGMAQFHPAYAYEDFVQGYRPSGTGFHLKDGIFHQFCRRAQADESKQYVFVIDEINRGNLSKVFGELMMLIEADKRSEQWAIQLAYSASPDDKFFVPHNVYLLGLMNTADRSLAMVDYALRRRFAFVDLASGIDTPQFAEYLESRGASDTLVERIVQDMRDLNEDIARDTSNLGPGFCVGHSYFCSDLRQRSLSCATAPPRSPTPVRRHPCHGFEIGAFFTASTRVV